MSKIFQNPSFLASIGIMVLIALTLLYISKKSKKKANNPWNTKALSFGALSMALSFVLGLITLYTMPRGGSLTPGSMLPLILYSYANGPGYGLIVSMAYGLIDFIRKPIFLSFWQFILDYIIGFGALGLSGLFWKYKSQKGMYLGIVLAGFLRFFASFLSGIVFFGSYAPKGQATFIYSLLYNGTYMLPEVLICLFIAAVIGERVVQIMRAG